MEASSMTAGSIHKAGSSTHETLEGHDTEQASSLRQLNAERLRFIDSVSEGSSKSSLDSSTQESP